MFKKSLRAFSALCLIGIIAVWLGLGSNIGWTKTSVPTQKIDEVTGIEYPVFENRFVPGIDFLTVGLLGVFALAAVSFLPTPKKTTL